METYETGPDQLDAALKGLSESQLDLSRAEGKWTIRQIVHHIVDTEDLWETVIKAALGNTGCTFDASWYIPGNKCAVPLDYANRPIDEAVTFQKPSALYRRNGKTPARRPGTKRFRHLEQWKSPGKNLHRR